MKIIFRTFLVLFIILFILISYLSFVGIETDNFNNQISKKINNLNENLDIDLKKIYLVFDPFNFKLNIKTIGPKLKSGKQTVEIESVKTQISLKSFFEGEFSIENLDVSTKSMKIKETISFIRSLKDSPQLFILEKIVKNGYIISNLKLEFDSTGKIKKNYIINGFVKDTKLSLTEKYKIDQLNFDFNYEKNKLIIFDTNLLLNNLSLNSKELIVKKNKKDFIFQGNLEHQNINLNKRNLELFLNPILSNNNIKEFIFSSKNDFTFKLNNKYKIENLNINSKTKIEKILLINELDLEKVFPKINKEINLLNNELKINYKKDYLDIDGKGDVLIQNSKDTVSYKINKKKDKVNFSVSLNIRDNPIILNFLNYEKEKNKEAVLKFKGTKKKDQLLINSLLLQEGNNLMQIRNLVLDKKSKIRNFTQLKLDYTDKINKKNVVTLNKMNNEYFLKSPFFNGSVLIDELLIDEFEDSSIFNINNRINIDIDEFYIDDIYSIKNFSGSFFLTPQEIKEANLKGFFSDNKKLKFTVNSNDNEKITTLYVDNAEPIIKRYKFIKGFEEGSLDYYSSNKSGKSISTLKIYDFKLKEAPVLTKILTLASLQGIADILSGEGIRFNEFEMNFNSKKDLMTIDEIYAIGPAISILMDGYVEKNKLVSLRGTLVPATTINKAIGSIPVLGKILVGTKTGEGVFGVSFKIKGPPKNLETTVNPIKTLTPRFITRTLEKIKKN